MTSPIRRRAAVPPWGLALTAMFSVQLGSALSVDLISAVGPAGTAWLRLGFGALIFLAIARPPLRSVRRADVAPLLALGVTTGLVTISFLAAIERIPLGTAVAIEFLGPLTVAAIHGNNRRALAWPAVALVGVVLLTEPWQGDVNLAGIAFAGFAAIGWATYIVLTQRVGDRFDGITGLTITVPIAAITAGVVGIPQAAGHLTPGTLAAAAGLAILLPVLPFTLEMLALRQMTPQRSEPSWPSNPASESSSDSLVLHQAPPRSRWSVSSSSSSRESQPNATDDAGPRASKPSSSSDDATARSRLRSINGRIGPTRPRTQGMPDASRRRSRRTGLRGTWRSSGRRARRWVGRVQHGAVTDECVGSATSPLVTPVNRSNRD